jgi:FMN phosphatase YigB (HAD superfamily)
MLTPPQPHSLTPRVEADQIRAVVFDAYGTLVEITDKRQPYKKLQELLPVGSEGRQRFGRTVMSEPLDLEETALRVGLTPSPSMLARTELDLKQELASIRLFDDVASCLSKLKERGFLLAICSNLAAPYAHPVKQLTGITWDAAAWSFEVGAIKPDREIYACLWERLNLQPSNVLMIGDTENEDYLAPVHFGMQAIRLRRGRSRSGLPSISTLSDLPALVSARLPAR